MMRSTVGFAFLCAFLFLVGCEDRPRQLSENEVPSLRQERQSPYIDCIGELSEIDPNYPWFEYWTDSDGTKGHDTGASPKATFRLVAPERFAGRTVGIVFKYTGEHLPPPPSDKEKGKRYGFVLPADFFTGNFKTIDNGDVGQFHALH